jgi:glutaconyl-CoA/methylmalonyl-CoA decarboxylase subunit gamma
MSPSSSRRNLTLKLNGRSYHIEVEDLDRSPLEIKVDGTPYQVLLDEAPTEAIPTPARQAAGSSAAPSPTTAPVTTGAPPAYSAQEIRSPMPGNILDIAVAAGDQVSVGQPLCALEAMKMKSAIRSPREGVIAEVLVNSGQVVVHGELLFTFE